MTTRWIRPEAWHPVGVPSLETAAEDVTRSAVNTLVIAGPGAGKTELLAQRAHYLLTTGACPPRRRILAISFKRDAARNLKDRVAERCGELGRRFDSFTLDSFAKGLVDRFLGAIPPDWRPHSGYEVSLVPPNANDSRGFLDSAGVPDGFAPLNAQSWSDSRVRDEHSRIAHGASLAYDDPELDAVTRHLGLMWWRRTLDLPADRPGLTFPMLNRLAAFTLRTNPKIHAAMLATYSHVFLDEFQDTTGPQYDLVRTAFKDSEAVLTAVGDSKQRIMLWAGALDDAFDRFQHDFNVQEPRHLTLNHRAAPGLIRMINSIADSVEAGTSAVTGTRDGDGGACFILEFGHHEQEAEQLAQLILDTIESGIAPRAIAVLLKQRVSEMIAPLQLALAARGVALRDESKLQDLLSEPAVSLILSLLRLATHRRHPDAWRQLTKHLETILGFRGEDEADLVLSEASRLLDLTRRAITGLGVEDAPAVVLNIIGPERIRSTFRQYLRGGFLQDCVEGLSAALAAAPAANDLRSAVEYVAGDNIVPAMTIHKSKGLEFHTVIFMGLEDSQWWSFRTQPEEDKRAFFVAFSRAMHQVYFTFCDVREERWGSRSQERVNIDSLYAILGSAGVPTDDRRYR